MMRWVQVLSVVAAVCAAIFVFQIKYRAEHVAEHVAELQRQVDSTNEAVSALKAEWSYLIQPGRVQDLVGRHSDELKLVPLDARQIIAFDKLPFRPLPKPEDEAALSAILGNGAEAAR